MTLKIVKSGEITRPVLRPFCDRCGWRKGGPDSWDGVTCKCGINEPPIEMISETPPRSPSLSPDCDWDDR